MLQVHFETWLGFELNQGVAQLRWQHEQSSGAPHGEGRTVGGGDLRWRVVCNRSQLARHGRIDEFPPFCWVIKPGRT